jgi:hypothetical protein
MQDHKAENRTELPSHLGILMPDHKVEIRTEFPSHSRTPMLDHKAEERPPIQDYKDVRKVGDLDAFSIIVNSATGERGSWPGYHGNLESYYEACEFISKLKYDSEKTGMKRYIENKDPFEIREKFGVPYNKPIPSYFFPKNRDAACKMLPILKKFKEKIKDFDIEQYRRYAGDFNRHQEDIENLNKYTFKKDKNKYPGYLCVDENGNPVTATKDKSIKDYKSYRWIAALNSSIFAAMTVIALLASIKVGKFGNSDGSTVIPIVFAAGVGINTIINFFILISKRGYESTQIDDAFKSDSRWYVFCAFLYIFNLFSNFEDFYLWFHLRDKWIYYKIPGNSLMGVNEPLGRPI